jgi:hypothetical protein
MRPIHQRQLAVTLLFGGCILGLAILAVGAVFDRDVPIIAKFLLLILGLAVGTVLVRSDVPRHWSGFLRPQFASAGLLAAAAAFSLLIDVRSVLEPTPARESKPFALERGQDRLAESVNALRRDVRAERDRTAASNIVNRIGGLWGEPGCRVQWRITLKADALTAEFARRPVGAKPWTFVGTVLRQSDTSLDVMGEAPQAAKGYVATFAYETNGVTEALTWNDRSLGTPLVLERCRA